MVNESKRLRLSRFTVPDFSIGRAPLTPQNSQFDSRRLTYLTGMVVYLNRLLEDLTARYSSSEALSRFNGVRAQLPYSELVQININGKPEVTPIPTAFDRIAFNHERMKMIFLDGLHGGAESHSIPVGTASPEVSHIISELSRGVSHEDLSRIFEECQLDLWPAIRGLRESQLIEEVDASSTHVAKPFQGDTDCLSWLGHAGILFQSPHSTICVDPYLRPHIRWNDKDITTCFSQSYGDHFFFDAYGPLVKQLSPAELPHLDAVFITHQDVDHCNLGVLMMLPEDVPIIVPEFDPNHLWEVDLSSIIRSILGERRKVVRLKHGETITIGDIRATAFPFLAEMPSSLKTLWNCYLFETNRSAVACTADSAVMDESADFMIGRLEGQRKPFALCARLVHSGEKTPGHRDEIEAVFNFTRLWAWYIPVWDLFQPVEVSGISESCLRRLAQHTNLRFFLPYAMGTAPWFRIADVNDPLHIPLANLSANDLRVLSERLRSIPGGPILFPGKFGQPFPLVTEIRGQ